VFARDSQGESSKYLGLLGRYILLEPMIPRDKLLHIAMGVGAVIVTLLAVWLAQWNLGAALAFVTTAFGIFYEAQQKY